MNEHIIVTENNSKILKHLIKVNKISKISEYDNNGKKCAVLHFIDGLDIDEGYAAVSTINELRVLETVNELEALIMGPKISSDESMGMLNLVSHKGPCIISDSYTNRLCEICVSKLEIAKIDKNEEFDGLPNNTIVKPLNNASKKELLTIISSQRIHVESLKEENAKLKQELKDTQEACDKYNRLWSSAIQENSKLKDQLAHSNAANHCCRETFEKLNNYYGGANIKHYCASEHETIKHGQLESWRQSFKDKIKETKNDL